MECKSATTAAKKETAKRINRYIMECKFTCYRNGVESVWELIDTLWNVNKFID